MPARPVRIRSSAPWRPTAPRVFSGIQPSGNLTLGNYLGALRRWVEMQDEGIETLYCVVDLHAITVWQEPAKLRQATREVAAAFLAIGLDPARSILFNQSQVPAHAELAWIFNCVARLGWLNRMTQFKEKAGKDREASSVGLYAYPALMAADILAYHGTHVPVGEDQKQHVELTRDIAAKFNHDFGVDFFPLPEPVIEGAATRVMSLARRHEEDVEVRPLGHEPDQPDRRRRRHRAEDPQGPHRPRPAAGDAGRAGRAGPRRATSSTSTPRSPAPRPSAVVAEFAGRPFSAFKPALADLAVAQLAPITGRMNALMADPAEIDRILGDGAAPRRGAGRADPGADLRHRRPPAQPLSPRLRGGRAWTMIRAQSPRPGRRHAQVPDHPRRHAGDAERHALRRAPGVAGPAAAW